MKRVMLTVAYDGTNYCGWQIQPDAVTIEEVLNRNLTELLQEEITVIGASRTDSGVHALGNVAVFDTNSRIPGEKISFALNSRLPKDIVIQDSREVPLDFHPRHCDSKKTYQYQIVNNRFPIPTKRLYAHFVYYPLNIEAMKEASRFLIGEHDFKSFCSSKTQVESTVRTVYDIKIQEDRGIISITISGSGFLYNMVRIITGTLLNVGLGQYAPSYVKEILEKKDRQFAGPTAPAHGLTLLNIEYPDLVSGKDILK